MFGKIGLWQLVIVFGVFVVLFGYKKVPEIGKTLGQGLRNFRKSVAEGDEIDITPKTKDAEQEKEKTTEQK